MANVPTPSAGDSLMRFVGGNGHGALRSGILDIISEMKVEEAVLGEEIDPIEAARIDLERQLQATLVRHQEVESATRNWQHSVDAKFRPGRLLNSLGYQQTLRVLEEQEQARQNAHYPHILNAKPQRVADMARLQKLSRPVDRSARKVRDSHPRKLSALPRPQRVSLRPSAPTLLSSAALPSPPPQVSSALPARDRAPREDSIDLDAILAAVDANAAAAMAEHQHRAVGFPMLAPLSLSIVPPPPDHSPPSDSQIRALADKALKKLGSSPSPSPAPAAAKGAVGPVRPAEHPQASPHTHMKSEHPQASPNTHMKSASLTKHCYDVLGALPSRSEALAPGSWPLPRVYVSDKGF